MSSQRSIRRYSLAVQQQVVQEIESGKYSIRQAQQLYDIGGSQTIARWLRRHGKQHLLSTIIHIQMQDERPKIQQLEARVRELEGALANAHLEKICLQGLVEVLEEEDGERVKKKIAQRPSNERDRLRRLLGRS